jgi:uncharacterized protein (UPF0548 family)
MAAARVLPPVSAARLRAAPLTYPEAGQTAGPLPPGYCHPHRSARVGRGSAEFTAAARTLLTWQMHQRSGLRVAADSPWVSPGGVVVLGLGIGPLRISAPCRVIYAVDEPDCQGFAYGTLPGHPESGEEAFLIRLHDTGIVTATITAFSRPASLPARAAGRAGRLLQSLVTARYLRALAQ